MYPAPSENPTFSLVRDDVWYRIQRRLGLFPAGGKDHVLRRTLVFSLLAWLPLMAWALATGHAFKPETGESLLRHYSIHARFLIALPALILGEALARSTMKHLLQRFVAMGMVTPEKQPAFRELIGRMIRLRNSTLPWIAIAGVIVLWILLPETGHRLEELNWAREHGHLGFGGWWYLLVSRIIFQIFLLGWLWRIVLLSVFFRRIAKLGLDLVPAHPDRLGGLAFICGSTRIFAPLAFACSCVLASKWAHEIAWHGAHVSNFKLQAATFVAVILLLSQAPLAAFMPVLKKARKRALAEYGELVARHGRLVRRIWIHGADPGERSILEAPELGPSCDINSLYDSVRGMRSTPFGKASLIPVLLAAALPLLAVSTMEIPILDLVGKVMKTLL